MMEDAGSNRLVSSKDHTSLTQSDKKILEQELNTKYYKLAEDRTDLTPKDKRVLECEFRRRIWPENSSNYSLARQLGVPKFIIDDWFRSRMEKYLLHYARRDGCTIDKGKSSIVSTAQETKDRRQREAEIDRHVDQSVCPSVSSPTTNIVTPSHEVSELATKVEMDGYTRQELPLRQVATSHELQECLFPDLGDISDFL